MTKIEQIINDLQLQPHPEGGYYKETYRSTGIIDADSLGASYSGPRNYSTAIYFLLTSDTFSAFHKINQDEFWHFYDGATIELHVISEDGKHEKILIGKDYANGEIPQYVVPGNHWFAAKVIEPNDYSLVGCTVSPGFDFDDFVLPSREEMLKKFPQHRELITEFTR